MIGEQLQRPFRSIILDWDGTAVASRQEEPEELLFLIESLPARTLPLADLILLYTAYITEDEEQLSLKSGVCRCLLKGMSLKELAAELVRSVGSRYQDGSSPEAA